MKLKYALLILIFSVLFLIPASVAAQTPSSKYVWEYEKITNVANAADLQQKLNREIEKIIQTGHLAPFRTLYGESNVRYYWFRRFETIYTLSLAHPYVSSSLQPQLKTYIKNELTQYPIWITSYGDQFLKANVGTQRNQELNLTTQQRTNETAGYEYWYRDWPKLFGIYSLWLYAQNTGDWQYIEQNWTTIKNFYNSNRAEASKYYQSIAGAIAMARLATQKPTPDQAMATTAQADASNGLTAGLNFSTFVTNANSTFYSPSRNFVFQYLTPEVTRFIDENSTLKQAAIGIPSDDSSFTRAETRYPTWYLAQSPNSDGWYGEGFSANYEIRHWLFPYQRWILKDPPSKLRLYVDVPDALVGDYFYLQNLTRTIEAHGQECWVDIQTGQETCGPVPSISPQPSNVPSPSPSLTSDFNHDGTVNAQDGKLLITDWLQPGTCGLFLCDTNQDSKNNSLDFAWVVKDWGN